jgi:hypothetical protein
MSQMDVGSEMIAFDANDEERNALDETGTISGFSGFARDQPDTRCKQNFISTVFH